MNPWWLRPPAEEEQVGERVPEKAGGKSGNQERPAKAEGERQGASRTRKATHDTRRSGRARGGSPRRTGGGGKRAPVEARDASRATDELGRIALFCDLESIALGLRESKTRRFELKQILESLAKDGRLVVKRAYADWRRHSEFNRGFHAAGMELIDIPQKNHSGKNSADVRLAVDAMELCYSKRHLDTFVIVSGDGDFSPLASKLRENNKRVVGVGIRGSASSALVENCDQYLYYDELARRAEPESVSGGIENEKQMAFNLLVGVIEALQQNDRGVLWGSLVKQEMRRRDPSFNEAEIGFSTFSEMLEDADRRQIIELGRDDRSGSYFVAGLAEKATRDLGT